MKIFKFSILLASLGLAASMASAATASGFVPRKLQLTPQQTQEIQTYQKALSEMPVQPLYSAAPARPFSELETAGYLFFSADFTFDSLPVKRGIAENLPADMTLVVYAEPGRNKAGILKNFEGVIDPSRIKVVELSATRNGFWSRDGLPVPSLMPNGDLAMVDARYYYPFEPDAVVAGWYQSPVIKNKYYHEGGNFVVNDKGDCLVVNNERAVLIPDTTFEQAYGCHTTTRFPYIKGIGHADESLKFLASDLVVTDAPSYKVILEKAGFKVQMLPRPDREFETYVNALLVNGTIFVPVFNEKNDQKALDVYKNAGFKVVPLNTSSLSNDGLGSIHCITMNYPKMPFPVLMKTLGGNILE